MSGTGQPNPDDLRPIDWTEAEPTRLQRDLRDVADFNTAFGAALQYAPPGTALVGSSGTTPVTAAGRSDAPAQTTFDHGGWHGTLPLWPFDRHAPDGLDALTDGTGLEFTLTYPAAYPMVPPTIWPLAPQPEMVERTQATWHVLPSGGLCLLQSDGAWQPEASLVDLLLKAAGWRVEYVLMKAHVIDAMAVSGIVSDSSFDHLVTQTATAPTTPGPASGAVGTPSG
ncbi:MAG TPA: hypothetical protein VFK43_22285, partial [Acidimicrobiales bacterium]|nr:hypothetical protein [Acidimicrobiales bacterium]